MNFIDLIIDLLISETFTNWFLATVTLIGIILAFLQDNIRDKIWKPKIKVFCKNSAPYVQIVRTTDPNVFQAWVGFGILNKSKTPAMNVQTIINCIESPENIKFKEIKNINLHLPYDRKLTLKKKLYKSVPQKWDLGYIHHFEGQIEKALRLEQIHPFNFDTYRTPLELIGLKPGIFKFEIIVFADNHRPVREIFEIFYDGGWNDDSEVFFKKHLRIKKIKKRKRPIPFFPTPQSLLHDWSEETDQKVQYS